MRTESFSLFEPITRTGCKTSVDVASCVDRIADIRDGQSIPSYVRYIERQLRHRVFTLEVLTELCRRYAVGVDDLAVWIAADRTGHPVPYIESCL